jgi:hypothetical protein
MARPAIRTTSSTTGAHGFSRVLVEQQGGASVLGFAPDHVRLRVDDGLVTSVHLG